MAAGDILTNTISSFKNFWQNFDVKSFAQRIGGSSSEAIIATVYFALFFSIGILFKKYFKFLFGCLTISIILIKIMEYNGLLYINWETIKLSAGISSSQDFNALINEFLGWIKNNIFLFVASIIGFLIGYKLG
jgi:hypothetical protein